MLNQLNNIKIETIIKVGIVLICLAPSFLFLIFGAMIGIALLTSYQGWIAYAALVALPAYALFCLCWTAKRKNHLQIMSLPLTIKAGLIFGVIATLLAAFKLLSSDGSLIEKFVVSWIFGLGPSVYLTTILFSMYPSRNEQRNIN